MINQSQPMNTTNMTLNTVNDRFGKVEAAYDINPINDTGVVELENSLFNNKLDYTVCVWVNSYRTRGDFISIGNSVDENYIVASYDVMYHDGDHKYFSGTTDNQWSHVCFVRDTGASLFKMYGGGTLRKNITSTQIPTVAEGVILFNDQDIVLGGYSINDQFKGGFQDFRIYNGIKSDSEILEIFEYVYCLEDEYYDPAFPAQGCNDCVHPCELCTSSDICQRCSKFELNRHAEPNCTCFDHYYENTSLDCIECPERYGNCMNDTTPITCRGNFRKNETLDCICEDGYYESDTTYHCDQCSNKCLRCTALNNCQQCEDNWYWDSISLSCQQCEHPCLNCVGDSGTCTSCVPGNFRNQTDNCQCDSHYFDNNLLQCEECSYKCQECSGTNISCDSCPTGSHRIGGNCECDQSYYDDGINPVCQSCPNQCLQCTASDNCQQCQGDLNWDYNLKVCTTCSYPCINCDAQDKCTQCAPGDHRDINNHCLCKDGYYMDSNNECQQCNHKCGTCFGNPDGCIVYCDSTCSSCDSNGKCTNCQIGEFLNEQLQCEKCSDKCQTCSQQAEQCQICSNGKNRKSIKDNCVCQDGYYEPDSNSVDCVLCEINNCEKCNENGDCLVCKNKQLHPKDCKYKKNFYETIIDDNLIGTDPDDLICKQGYYFDFETTFTCQKCHKSCKQCLKYDSCSMCDLSQNRVLNEFKNTCECVLGFRDNNKNQQCNKCYQYQGSCVQICPIHTIQDEEGGICQFRNIEQNNLVLLYWFVGMSFCVIIWLYNYFLKALIYFGYEQLRLKNEQNNLQLKENIDLYREYQDKYNDQDQDQIEIINQNNSVSNSNSPLQSQNTVSETHHKFQTPTTYHENSIIKKLGSQQDSNQLCQDDDYQVIQC